MRSILYTSCAPAQCRSQYVRSTNTQSKTLRLPLLYRVRAGQTETPSCCQLRAVRLSLFLSRIFSENKEKKKYDLVNIVITSSHPHIHSPWRPSEPIRAGELSTHSAPNLASKGTAPKPPCNAPRNSPPNQGPLPALADWPECWTRCEPKPGPGTMLSPNCHQTVHTVHPHCPH